MEIEREDIYFYSLIALAIAWVFIFFLALCRIKVF